MYFTHPPKIASLGILERLLLPPATSRIPWPFLILMAALQGCALLGCLSQPESSSPVAADPAVERNDQSQPSLAELQQALDRWRDVQDLKKQVEVLNKMAIILRDEQSRFDDALEFHSEALELAERTEDKDLIAQTLNKIGFTHNKNNNPEQAINFYEKSLDLRRTTGDQSKVATALNNLAAAYNKVGENHLGLQKYHEALSLQIGLPNSPTRTAIFNNVAAAYSALGQYDKALFYFDQALIHIRDKKQKAKTLTNVCRAQHFSGAFRLARSSCEGALALLDEVEDLKTKATALTNTGRVLHAINEPTAALVAYREALSLLDSHTNPRKEAAALIEMAFVLIDQGNWGQARTALDQGLALSREVKDQVTESTALLGLARLKRRDLRLLEALSDIEAAIALVERLRGRVIYPDHRATFLSTKRRLYEDRIDILMELHQSQPNGGFVARALHASEGARARALVDMLSEAQVDIEAGVDPDLLQKSRDLRRRMNSLEQRRLSLGIQAPEEERAALANQLSKTLAEYDQAQADIRARSPSYASLVQPRILGLHEIRQLLDPETVLLEYAMGANRSFLWAVTESSIHSWELPGRDDLEAAARRVYELLTARAVLLAGEGLRERGSRINQADANLPTAARRLSELILAPAAKVMKRRRLAIVAEGALEYVPFAALPSPDPKLTSDSPPMMTQHEIVRLPSASILAILRHDKKKYSATKKGFILADPVFDNTDSRVMGRPEQDNPGRKNSARAFESEMSFLPRLQSTDMEARMIERLLPIGHATLKLGFEASRRGLQEVDLTSHHILHFATHGLINGRYPGLSALVLARVDEQGAPVDGLLSLHDIYNLDLNAELAVLSACQTALGPEIRGEGLMGLTRGFMYAGASRVMASLWTVKDSATKELMELFYQGLLERGERPAVALRKAQISMWRENQFEDFHAPYYWAAFTLQGDWQ